MQKEQRKTEKIYRTDYYRLLGVGRKAKKPEIMKAYNKKMQELNIMDNDYQAKMKKLEEAHKTLINKERRKAYDKQFFGLSAKIKRAKKRYDKAYSHKKGIMNAIKRNIVLPFYVSLQHIGDVYNENPKKVLIPVVATTTALAILLGSVFMLKIKDEETLQKSPAQSPKETITAYYTVKEGDTLSEIAAEYGTTIDSCSGYGSGNSDQIGVGEEITMEIAKDEVPMVTAQTVWLAERDKQSLVEGYVSISYLANLCGTNEDSIKACNVDVETTLVRNVVRRNPDNGNLEYEEKELYPAGITIKLPFIDGSPLERSVFGNGTENIGLAGTDEIFPSGYFASQDPIATEKAPQKVYSLFSSQKTSPLIGGK